MTKWETPRTVREQIEEAVQNNSVSDVMEILSEIAHAAYRAGKRDQELMMMPTLGPVSFEEWAKNSRLNDNKIIDENVVFRKESFITLRKRKAA